MATFLWPGHHPTFTLEPVMGGPNPPSRDPKSPPLRALGVLWAASPSPFSGELFERDPILGTLFVDPLERFQDP